ncbi:NTF2-like protein [Exidia glandulosa HHB12029]|uniref:NTF2-like protein n=1 Tax=Exidia glandulosa HHB12029 TaxID=1314781 RepID=A0A165PQX0_EXIGL|nr:NTF2-like protein [Exidia glandulosa HHB12029]
MSSKAYPCAVASVRAPSTLILLAPESAVGLCDQYAQEGYSVVHVFYPAPNAEEALRRAASDAASCSIPWALLTFGLDSCDVGLVTQLTSNASLKAIVHYAPLFDDGGSLILVRENGHFIPSYIHLAASQEVLHASLLPLTDVLGLQYTLPPGSPPPVRVFAYPMIKPSPAFPLLATPMAHIKPGTQESVEPNLRSAISLSYSRTLELLRRELGPWFDLESLWEKHTFYEFEERNAPKTMATMVAEPYVNHIPTMTGGIGFELLSRFYKYHFIPKSPPDTEMICVSRTVGSDRVIDEMIFKCTHTQEVDWLLPGVAPTNKRLEIPLIGVVNFRGDKLTFEHIYWDQASVLVQAGILDPTGLPVTGSQEAAKVLNPFGEPSNTLMSRWNESEGLDIN